MVAGLGLAVISPVLPIVFDISKRWAWYCFGVGILILGAAAGLLLVPIDAQTPVGSTILAPSNGGIITQGQNGGTNIVTQSAAGSVGDNSVVMGRDPPSATVGNRSVVIGPTDAKGNTVIGPMIVGHGACGSAGDTAIGANVGTCPKSP